MSTNSECSALECNQTRATRRCVTRLSICHNSFFPSPIVPNQADDSAVWTKSQPSSQACRSLQTHWTANVDGTSALLFEKFKKTARNCLISQPPARSIFVLENEPPLPPPPPALCLFSKHLSFSLRLPLSPPPQPPLPALGPTLVQSVCV